MSIDDCIRISALEEAEQLALKSLSEMGRIDEYL